MTNLLTNACLLTMTYIHNIYRIFLTHSGRILSGKCGILMPTQYMAQIK